MQKKLSLCVLVILLSLPVFAGYFDLAFTLGGDAHLYERSLDPSRMKLATGLSLGLTDTWELDAQLDTQLIPSLFGDASLSIVARKALLGQRSTATNVAGVGINTLLGAGLMFSPYRMDGAFGLSHLLLSLTPLTVGTPVAGKRERLFTLNLAYNLETHQVSLLFDVILFDFYAVGTYRDYR
ncbi:MAG: hypothetical protein AB7C91_02650 [Sphaerochaeta sp.]|jgi:hypothetical protein|uniref:hypothetical protein n=1 Tax=Sphaerochaeta sp. TaxID=1972642 RepID=UPI002FCB1966